MHTRADTRASARTYTRTHVRMHARACAHTHTHTHTNAHTVRIVLPICVFFQHFLSLQTTSSSITFRVTFQVVSGMTDGTYRCNGYNEDGTNSSVDYYVTVIRECSLVSVDCCSMHITQPGGPVCLRCVFLQSS